jgi:chemotaxis-related protein WspB
LQLLLVRFQLGDTQLAIEASQIIEILPFISMPKVLRAPVGIAGAINYHGELVPVIDLSELVLGQSTRAQLSTRIIVTEFHEDNDTPCRLGLVAGNATETIRCEPADFLSPGIVPEDAPYLGSIVVGSRGQVQRIELNKLLPQSLRYALSKQRAAG